MQIRNSYNEMFRNLILKIVANILMQINSFEEEVEPKNYLTKTKLNGPTRCRKLSICMNVVGHLGYRSLFRAAVTYHTGNDGNSCESGNQVCFLKR